METCLPAVQGFVTAKSGRCICDPINAGPGCCFCVTPGTCGPQLTDAQAQLAYQVRPQRRLPVLGQALHVREEMDWRETAKMASQDALHPFSPDVTSGYGRFSLWDVWS